MIGVLWLGYWNGFLGLGFQLIGVFGVGLSI